jgi:predicted GH43/DUF377 family glycosyl hydrolase
MRWRKLGHVFASAGQHGWMTSYAGVPFAEHIEGDLFRIYFTSRDGQGRSHVGWLELDIRRPNRILRRAEEPLLEPGDLGSFDDAGTTLSCVVQHGGKRYVYYIGWSLRRSVPYHLAIGLAVGASDGPIPSVTRLPGPIVERNHIDPLFCTAPHVIHENGIWRMWYVSGTGWPEMGGALVPAYHTRYAESENGVDWRRTGLVALETAGDEFGFSRPSVVHDKDHYLMWYSCRARSHPYRLGFARSPDGRIWTRGDGDEGLEPSADGWDAEMICYPHVFDHAGDRYMVYCGNEFGRTGFGLAVRV